MLIYFISKLIPSFFQPLGLFFIFIIFFFKFRKKWIIFSSTIILWSFSTYFVSQKLIRYIEYPWKRLSYDSIDYSEAIVVLSGGLQPIGKESKIQEWADPDRFFAGVKLLKKNKAPYLVFTSGIRPLQPNASPESYIYQKEAIEYGIPINKIKITNNARNTFEEAFEVELLLSSIPEFQNKKITLVTSAFHMKRAKTIFERRNFKVIPFPVDFKSYDFRENKYLYKIFTFIPNSQNLNNSSLAIREIMGRIFYRIF